MAFSSISRVPRPVVSALVLVAASCATAAGFVTMMRYATTPGPSPKAPARMPAELESALASCEGTSLYSRPLLALCLHPQCPCSRATVDELDRIARAAGPTLAVEVFFIADAELGPDWTESDLWRAARAIPGAHVHADPDAALARRLGAEVSGTAILYGRDGALEFQGGITVGRGEPGASDGAEAIAAIVRGEEPRCRTTPVFGCGLGTGSARADSAATNGVTATTATMDGRSP
jgi:hypothetical protein